MVSIGQCSTHVNKRGCWPFYVESNREIIRWRTFLTFFAGYQVLQLEWVHFNPLTSIFLHLPEDNKTRFRERTSANPISTRNSTRTCLPKSKRKTEDEVQQRKTYFSPSAMASGSQDKMRGAFLHFLTVTPTGFDLLPSNLESKLSNEYLLNPFLQTIDEAIKGTKAWLLPSQRILHHLQTPTNTMLWF